MTRRPDVGRQFLRAKVARLQCDHESASGITQSDGPNKIWRCDGCGFLYRCVTDRFGITTEIPVLPEVAATQADALKMLRDLGTG